MTKTQKTPCFCNPVSLIGRMALALLLLLLSALQPFSPSAQSQERPVDRLQTEARGIYLLWAEKSPVADAMLALPFIHGGQVSVQWADVEPRQGAYDFSPLDKKIDALAGKQAGKGGGLRFTVQINGNIKPAWLFAQVPHITEKLHSQVQDKEGTLMFWHPVFQEAHLAMLCAAAAHLKNGPHNDRLLGIRMNWNAVGTEQTTMPAKYRNPDAWIAPPACKREDLKPFTGAALDAYFARVVETYIKEFSGWTVVFVRNNVDGDILEKLVPDFRAGRLGLFHTSSEAEPRTGGTERRYGLFYDFARSGDTVAYAEPWASAWGEHGGKLDDRWCSPCQWNYWTLLFNMHCGVSFIGEYAGNLAFALNGRTPALKQLKTVNPAQQAKEFMAAYKWADGYIGRHNRPAETPGAWVAFRANDTVKAANGVPADKLKLTRFTGDYNFLMERIGGDDGSKGVGPVGPADERYGAFARAYPAGTQARLKPEARFLATLTNGARLRVIYLDDTADETAVAALNEKQLGKLPRTGTGRWRVAEFDIAPQAAGSDWQIAVAAGEKPLILHMVELLRPKST